jgi:hypothetical protein
MSGASVARVRDCLSALLEIEFQHQLALAVAGTSQVADDTEVLIADTRIRRSEDGVVERILRFQSDFQPYPFMRV